MNVMILSGLALGIILLYLWFRPQECGCEVWRMRGGAEAEQGKKQNCLRGSDGMPAVLFRFGMQLQVNGAWIAYAGEEYKYIDWFSTADNLFIFLFPILLSAADLL